jgi:hypothetical protein
MYRLKTLVFSFAIVAAFAVTGYTQEKSLYLRLGGEAAISAVVDEFASIVL